MLMMRWFTLSQLQTLDKSEFSFCCSTSEHLDEQYKTVSSAKRMTFQVSKMYGMSSTYIKNNKGPRIDPCATPIDTYMMCQIERCCKL